MLSFEPGNSSAWMVSPGSSLSQSALQVQLEAPEGASTITRFTGLELARTVARGIITDNYLPAQLDLRYIRYKKYHKPLNGLEPCDVECISDSRDNRGDGGSPGLPSLGDVHLAISHLKDAISEFPNLG